MKIILEYIVVALMVVFTQTSYSQNCKKCDMDKLIELSENMENLNYQTVKNFVCTFDSICKNNIEFSEWSNELLFKLIDKNLDMLNGALHELGYNYVELISLELESPVAEVDLAKLYRIVEKSTGPKDITYIEKRALKKAAAKEGINIE
ncbi:MAG: hypothetical protein KKF98_00140 [Bacteroidetes bacterium]|nr:hypothetical protein [Bacteroidota bacterium]